ncbi:MAG: hypothetical protein JWM11_3559, partial [Planctomycetaceae bacterium]|nr:hypothetical protein [Planctomycetaceae bacterium]
EVAEIAAQQGRSKRSIVRILKGFREMVGQMIHDGQPDE